MLLELHVCILDIAIYSCEQFQKFEEKNLKMYEDDLEGLNCIAEI